MSNEIQQTTPFDGYGSDVVEYSPQAGMNGNGGNGNGGMMMRQGGMGAPAPEAAPQHGLAKKIHNSLRGRYWIGLIIGGLLGVAGGYFGYQSQQPIFRGEGMVQIAFNLKSPLQQTEDRGPMINYEEYVQSQAMMISSRRVIDMAMTMPDWKKTGLENGASVQNQIATNLSVEHPSRTELIRVYYTDKNPDVALNVVKSVIAAYDRYAKDLSDTEDDKQLTVLRARQSLVVGQIRNIDNQMDGLAAKYSTADLTSYHEAKLTEETKIESRLNEAELALATTKRKRDPKEAIRDLAESQIAMIDVQMRTYVMEREQVATEMAKLQAAGVLPGDRRMKQLQTLLDIHQRKVEQHAGQWRDMQYRLIDDPTLGNSGIARVGRVSEEVLTTEVAALRAKYEQLKTDRSEIGKQMLKMQSLQREREEAIKDKSEVERRIDLMRMNASLGSRLSIRNPGDVPIQPFKDRRKMFGAAGAVGGFGLPMGILVLLGLLDKRYRYSDEAGDGIGNVPLLGILPRLPDKLSDPEQAAVAAHCIHQIRIMLQVGQNPDKRRAFMVTSASTGDGKTSLTMALGLSFAASGSKTLVIDCDMVGQGLTHRLKAHNVPGLIETLNLGTLRGHVRKTASKGLYILPIGTADAVHAGVLSPQSIKRLLLACREHFDIVVIDTGPILGSLEASVVAAEVDGVIVAVARGQQQPLVEKAVKLLRSIGANIFGIVFNRAEQRDFQRSVASASIRSQSAKPAEQRLLLPESDESSRFGPLARSVASSLPSSSSHGHANGNGNGHGHSNGNGHGRGDA